MKLFILFRLNEKKMNNEGLCPIEVRLTYNGERRQRATSFQLTPKQWKHLQKKKSSNDMLVLTVQEHINTYTLKVQQLASKMEAEGIMHIDTLLEVLEGVAKPTLTILQLVKDHNQKMQQRVGVDRSTATLEKYQQLQEKLEAFIPFHYKMSDLSFSKVTLSFMEYFKEYLSIHCNLAHNTMVKYCKNLVSVTNYGWRRDLVTTKPFEKANPIGYEQIDRTYLNAEELGRLEKKQLPIERLQVVCDMFLFQCYTGLSYIDLKRLDASHLVKGADKKPWLQMRRQKSGTPFMVPLLPPAIRILDKYKLPSSDLLLPVSSNQKLNAYLKEIAVLCDIRKDLSTHVARRTFATTVTMENGISIESIARMLGHSSVKMTKLYAVVTDSKLRKEMQILAQQYKDSSSD